MVFYLPRKRRVLKRVEGDEDPNETQAFQSIEDEEELKNYFDKDRERAAAIDEKTFKLSLALTAALTVLGTLSPLLLDRFTSSNWKTMCAVFCALTVLYALSSGFIALGSMRALPVYGLAPTGLPPKATGAKRQLLISHIARNQIIGYARALRNEASYQLLRNGLICLSGAIAIYVVAVFLGRAGLSAPQSSPAPGSLWSSSISCLLESFRR